MSSNRVDLNMLLQNLRDLDKISRRVFRDFKQKNQILEEGLSDCKLCRISIDGNKHKWQGCRDIR